MALFDPACPLTDSLNDGTLEWALLQLSHDELVRLVIHAVIALDAYETAEEIKEWLPMRIHKRA